MYEVYNELTLEMFSDVIIVIGGNNNGFFQQAL